MSVVRTLRLVAGLACVAGGVSLAAPVVRRVAEAVRLDLRAMPDDAGARLATGYGSHGTMERSMAAPAAPAEGVVNGVMHAPPPVAPPQGTTETVAPPTRPAAPPVPPPWSIGWEAAPPLGQTYRSALEAPPPPLLDEAGPARRVATPVSTSLVAGSSRQPVAPAAEPSTYRVRDGDDLAGIAARLYGHPNAAAAIHAANQDIIPDPALLPIGLEIRLPPRWAFDDGGGTTIEPRSAFGTR